MLPVSELNLRTPRVYVCFDAAGAGGPAKSDIKYYYLLRAWRATRHLALPFVDMHELSVSKCSAESKETRLKRELAFRIESSNVLLLVVTSRTRSNTTWIPWEISFAAHRCDLPVICSYPGVGAIVDTQSVQSLWPEMLCELIDRQQIRSLHIPFRYPCISQAIKDCTNGHEPRSVLATYAPTRYAQWGF